MKKSIFLSVFIVVLSTTIHAQQDTSKALYMYHTSAQFQMLDFSDFNQQLADLNLVSLPGNNIELGFGGTQLYKRFFSELAIVFGCAENEVDDVRGPSSEFRYIGFRFSESINILNPKSDWFLGPEVSFNGSFQQILITGRNNGRNFQEAALNAVYNFERFTVTMDFGLNVNKEIRYKDRFSNPRIVNVGLRTGYRFDERESVWDLKQAIGVDNLGVYTGGWYGTLVLRTTFY